MREFINIQISDGLKTRLKEIAVEINAIIRSKSNVQEDIELDKKLQSLYAEKLNIENELKQI